MTLKVFDLLGREVVTLVNGERGAGLHNLIWNAAGHPSGVYLLQLTLQKESNKFSQQISKMILSK